MTWIKLDDNAPEHPKVAVLSDRAFRWWVRGLCYASRFLTDGLLPFVFTRPIPQKHINELRDAGLWEITGDGIHIHDYAEHQSAKADVKETREANRERQRRYKERRQQASGNAPVTPPVTLPNALPNALPSVTGDALLTRPENREQRTESREQRAETTPSASFAPPLTLSPLAFARLQERHAFVSDRLLVPNALHREFAAAYGEGAESALAGWYKTLRDGLGESESIGDVFAWLRPRFNAWMVTTGRVKAAPAAPRPGRQSSTAAYRAAMAAKGEVIS